MKKPLKRTRGQAVARAILDMDHRWTASFGDIGLNDLNYCDLFCSMWSEEQPFFAKTVLCEFMPGVSRRTAVRYVQSLIDGGWLEETNAGHDRRIKYVTLSKAIADRLERFLAYVDERFALIEG
jgi:hypothetical protein